MRHNVLMSGLGGQGVLMAGQLLAQAAIEAGLETSWFPSYSPEVRGGSVECTLVVSDGRVGSPVVGRPQAAVLMAPVCVDQYAPKIEPGGIAVLNVGMGKVAVGRDDVRVFEVDANAIAREAGSERVVNLVLAGAWLGLVMPELIDKAVDALARVLPERHHKLIPMNAAALRAGAQAAEQQAG